MASRVLGLVRDSVQAHLFGTGDQVDAFYVATRIPTLLRDLFAEGAMSAAFVPTFTRYLTKDGRQAAWRLGSQVINALLIVTGVLVVLGIIFAEPLAGSYAKKYAEIPGKLELTVQLTRLNMPFLLLIAVAAAFMGMLNALRRFFIPATSPTLYNAIFIVCALMFTPLFVRWGISPVMSLTAGMLLGGVGQILLQWPTLRKEGYRHEWRLNFRDPGLREVLVLMGPGTLGVAAAQVNLFVNTVLATQEREIVASLSYAFRLMYLPIGIFGVSVATAAIPDLARHAAHGSYEHMRTTLSWGLRLMLVLSVPSTVGLMVLSYPITQLIFERGAFDPHSTVLVSSALFCYAPGIVGYCIVKIASPSFYSMRDARTPVLVSLVTIVVNLGLNISLYHFIGYRGLALGTAIAASVNAGLLLWLLDRRIGGMDGRRVSVTLVKTLIASLVMGAAAYFTEVGLHALLPGETFLVRLIRVVAAIAAGLGVFALSASALGIEEFMVAMRRILIRLGRTPPAPPVC